MSLENGDKPLVLPMVRRKLSIKGPGITKLSGRDEARINDLLDHLEAVRMRLGLEWLEISNRPSEDR